ncbi:unnamed protein product [Blumeria hordei]|uniref:F-box domain-containing protein n=1 Tax=Blumeria hordei TaxID=2867405 RepID=A0A383V2R8_BLUHO|nr:unnamed protein product [Blumeria hordei]
MNQTPNHHAPISSRPQIPITSMSNPIKNYCYRHQPNSKCRNTADEPSMELLQKELETFSQCDQKSISLVWSLFSAASAKRRHLMLQGILAQCCFPQLSYLSTTVRELIRIDFITALPTEISVRILCFLDTKSLCKAAQVNKGWKILAEDDVIWHRMCEQHIHRKCTKCGWGLPLLERKKLRTWKRQKELHTADLRSKTKSPAPQDSFNINDSPATIQLNSKACSKRMVDELDSDSSTAETSLSQSKWNQREDAMKPKFRPWKEVYKDRFQVGSNWKYGRCSTKVFRGHLSGVSCLQFDDNVLATGSRDFTIKIWNLEKAECIRTLRGHRSGVEALQFDNQKLISGSLDKTIRVWNWRTGECINQYLAHQSGVIALNFVGNLLASGSMDTTIKVWNFEDKSVFALHGHTDWVNAIKVDEASRTLLSASDDRSVRLWDLDTHQTIQVFDGHVGQVQQVSFLPKEFEFDHVDGSEPENGSIISITSDTQSRSSTLPSTWYELWPATRPKPPRYILTGALDCTVRLWDVSTGLCLRTFFGHLEGIWALAADTLRVVTGAEDKLLKVWDIRSGRCEKTFSGHVGSITCIGLSDSRMCTGSEDSEVRMYSFKHEESRTISNVATSIEDLT